MLENFEVHFRGPVGSIEGPSRVLDLMRVHLSVPRASFSLFIKLYFVYKVQGSSDKFFIFVIVTRDMIISTTAIVTVAMGR